MENNIIRKIVIGADIVNSGMNYRVGQILRQANGDLRITEIIRQDDKSHTIYVERSGTKFAWKHISTTTPTTVEYSIQF